jgi:hypothetical protein
MLPVDWVEMQNFLRQWNGFFFLIRRRFRAPRPCKELPSMKSLQLFSLSP